MNERYLLRGNRRWLTHLVFQLDSTGLPKVIAIQSKQERGSIASNNNEPIGATQPISNEVDGCREIAPQL